MKKINIITAVLLIYLGVMSYIGWPGNKENPNYTEYFIVIGITLVVIFLFRYTQIRRLKLRKKKEEEWFGDEQKK